MYKPRKSYCNGFGYSGSPTEITWMLQKGIEIERLYSNCQSDSHTAVFSNSVVIIELLYYHASLKILPCLKSTANRQALKIPWAKRSRNMRSSRILAWQICITKGSFREINVAFQEVNWCFRSPLLEVKTQISAFRDLFSYITTKSDFNRLLLIEISLMTSKVRDFQVTYIETCANYVSIRLVTDSLIKNCSGWFHRMKGICYEYLQIHLHWKTKEKNWILSIMNISRNIVNSKYEITRSTEWWCFLVL